MSIIKNISKPAPKWFRITKKIVYGLFVTSLFSDTAQRLGMSDKDVLLMSGWLVSIMETLSSILANGEEYINPNYDTSTTDTENK